MDDRTLGELARRSLARGDPVGWFEDLYQAAGGEPEKVPWAHLAPSDALLKWLETRPVAAARILVVGCGLGDDAEALAAAGAEVTAFDVSATCIAWCKRRFPDSRVRYEVADLMKGSSALSPAELVIEVATLQSLPIPVRETAMQSLAALVASGGELFVGCRGRADDPPPTGDDPTLRIPGPPWPVSHDDLGALERHGLRETSFADFTDEGGTRRFVARYTRP